MQLSQVDPWNGCRVCRTLAERGILPNHTWTHELRMWWSNKKTTRTRMAGPENGAPERHEDEGLKSSPFLGVYYGAGVLAALLSRSDVVRGIVRAGEVVDAK